MEPGYQYREIICGCCRHRFVFNKTPGEWGLFICYKKKNGVNGIDTKCPKCGKGILAFDDEITALPFELREDREEIERQGFIAM